MIQEVRIVFMSVFLEVGNNLGVRIIFCLYFSQNLNIYVEFVLKKVLAQEDTI